MRVLIVVLAGAISVSPVSCTREQRTNPTPIPSPAAPQGYASRIGSPVAPREVWPVPADASRNQDRTATQLIYRGSGQVLPAVNRDVVTGIAIVEYNTRGEVIGHVPFKVQAID